MRIRILTSCTGRKRFKPQNQLTYTDFVDDGSHLQHREHELNQYCLPAAQMYTGQQHVRLMEGIRAVREIESSPLSVELFILSAGYGLIAEDRQIAPYECTFNSLSAGQSEELMQRTGSVERFHEMVQQPSDLNLILLGNSYLRFLNISSSLRVASPTLFIAGKNTAERLLEVPMVQTLSLTNYDAQRFSCGMVGLKGEIASRMLRRLSMDTSVVPKLLNNPRNVLDELVDLP